MNVVKHENYFCYFKKKKNSFTVLNYYKSLKYKIMRSSKIILILLLGIFVVFQSCEKKALIDVDDKEIINDDDIAVKNGMLVFENIEEINGLFSQMSEEDFKDRQTTVGFVSLKGILEQALKEEESYYEQFDPTTMTKEEIAKVVKEKEMLGYTEFTKKYIDLGIIRPYTNDDISSLELTVVSWVNIRFLNIDGMVMIDNVIYQFTATQCKKLTDGDFSKIAFLKQTTKDNTSQSILVGNLFNNLKDYHQRIDYDYKQNGNNWGSEKIEAEVWIRRWDFSSHKQYLYYLRYRNYRKNIWGNWKEDNDADTDITGSVKVKYNVKPYPIYSINYSHDNLWADNPHVYNLYNVPLSYTVTFLDGVFYFKRDQVNGLYLYPPDKTL